MDDLISKSKVIEHIAQQYTAHGEAIPEWLHIGDLPSTQPEKCEDCVNFNKARLLIPQPERKTGKWIIEDNPKIRWYRVTCSECGEDVTSVIPLIGFFPIVKPLWDFCPNCGARMEVEE